MKKKRAFTLLEIMIVIFLIGLIGSIIGYNMKGSLDEGKAFKSKQAIMKLKDIFDLEMAKGVTAQQIKNDPVKFLKASGIANKPDKLMKDGWGNPFDITIKQDGTLKIFSKRYGSWKSKKTALRGHDLEE